MLTLGLCAAVLGGCGGGDDEPGRTVTASGGSVRVAADEYSFDPQTIRTTPGDLRITLENRGNLAHNLKVAQGEGEVGGTPTFPGGRSESGTVRLEPGEYRMVCTVGNHEELGMVGALVVE